MWERVPSIEIFRVSLYCRFKDCFGIYAGSGLMLIDSSLNNYIWDCKFLICTYI